MIAKSSLLEVQDRLVAARHRTYLPEPEFARIHALSDRAVGANVRLQQYLRGVSGGRRS